VCPAFQDGFIALCVEARVSMTMTLDYATRGNSIFPATDYGFSMAASVNSIGKPFVCVTI